MNDIIFSDLSEAQGWLLEFKESLEDKELFCKSFKEITATAYKNEDYLYRVFRQQFKVSLKDYIHNLKLNYVAQLLAETDMKIIEIFYEAGYENISWGNVIFKKKFGISPSAYRKKHRNTA